MGYPMKRIAATFFGAALALSVVAAPGWLSAPALAQWVTCGAAGQLCTNSQAYMGGGRPWCDVRAKGAVGNGSTNDYAAFQGCIDLLSNNFNQGTVRIGPGTYCVTSKLLVGTNKSIKFDVDPAAIISTCGTDVILLEMGGTWSEVSNGFWVGKGSTYSPTAATDTFGALQPVIKLTQNCVGCYLHNLRVDGGAGLYNNAADSRYYNVHVSYSYNRALMYFGGPTAAAGIRVTDSSSDGVWFTGLPAKPTTVSARANTTGYTAVNSLVSVTCSDGLQYVWQAKTTGTSGGSQPACKNYAQDIVDGTVTWQLLMPTPFYLMNIDSNTSEVMITGHDFSGASTSNLAITNSLGGTVPFVNHVDRSILSVSISHSVDVQTGNGFLITNSHLYGCMDTNSCAMVNFASGFTDHGVVGNNLITGAQSGVQIVGGDDITVTGNNFFSNARALYVAPDQTDFVFANNTSNDTACFLVDAGASNRYSITNNDCHGTSKTDNGTGTAKTVAFNDGSALAAINGGTGQTSYAVGDILYASTTSALSKLAGVATGNALISGGVNTAPSWGKVGLTTHVSGTLAVGNGGTGATTLTSNGVLYGNGTGAIQATAQGGANTVLVANAGAPSFTAAPTFGTSATAPFFNATTQGTGLQINGVSVVATSGSEYLIFKGVASGHQIFLGGSNTDKQSYYGNDTHTFRDFATSTNFATINSTKIAALQTTASTSSTTGAITSAGGIGAAGAIVAGTYLQTSTGVAVASLPTCSATTKGARHLVTDANATTFLSTVAGGGANIVPVVCDGTNWKIG